MNNQQHIPCPTQNCSGKILIDPNELIRGAHFSCPVCNVSIGVAPESRETVNEAIEKFGELKQKIAKMEGDNS
jgi:hypothetical protein